MILGHVGLSPMTGDEAAFALAPVAVAPAMQRRGIGQALVRAALAGAGSRPVVVLGAPDYYARLGFRPADLDSPHAGPFLQVAGDLPAGARIRHAPAFEAV
jgi:putative acetyltransferase